MNTHFKNTLFSNNKEYSSHPLVSFHLDQMNCVLYGTAVKPVFNSSRVVAPWFGVGMGLQLEALAEAVAFNKRKSPDLLMHITTQGRQQGKRKLRQYSIPPNVRQLLTASADGVNMYSTSITTPRYPRSNQPALSSSYRCCCIQFDNLQRSYLCNFCLPDHHSSLQLSTSHSLVLQHVLVKTWNQSLQTTASLKSINS